MGAKSQRPTLAAFDEFVDNTGMIIRYNQLLKTVEYSNMPEWFDGITDVAGATPTYIREEFGAQLNTNVSPQIIHEYIYAIADRYAYNPVKAFYDSIRGIWDNVDRFPDIFEMLSVTNEFHRTLIWKWFSQCVALTMNTLSNPISAEGVLILSGAEGMGKSQFFRRITPNPKWFRCKDTKLRLSNKDDLLNTVSGFIVELGEIDSTIQCNGAELKSFITAEADSIRRPYHRAELTTPRTTSFCGTTNKAELLTDDSGYRRWWLVPVNADIQKIIEFTNNTDWLCQFWAQCVAAIDNDITCFRLTKEEQQILKDQNADAVVMPKGTEDILELFDFDTPVSEWEWIRPADIKNRYEARLPRGITLREVGRACAYIATRNKEVKGKKPQNKQHWLMPKPKGYQFVTPH